MRGSLEQKSRTVRASLRAACFVVAALPGCKHEEAQSNGSPAAAESAQPAPPPSTAAAPAAEFHDENFDLSIVPAGPYASGKEGTAEIVLVAKGIYHVNDKYPYKFKVVDSPGISYKAPVFTRDDVAIEEKRATMKVLFTPATPGGKTLGGTFAFSVCSADHCLVEKKDLALALSVN